MNSLASRVKVVIILLGIAAALTALLSLSSRTEPRPANLGQFPMVIGKFMGNELPVEDSVKEILETPNILMREYVGPGGIPLTLAIVYYERYRVSFHMPEGCMVGRGSTLVGSEREALKTSNEAGKALFVNKLTLKQSNRNEHVYYFFLVGNIATPSYAEMRFHLMKEHFRRRNVGVALIRFSATSEAGDDQKLLSELRNFVGEVNDLLPANLG